jgi:hypothetical protein
MGIITTKKAARMMAAAMACGACTLVALAPSEASADEARVTVGSVDDGFARPPPRPLVLAVDPRVDEDPPLPRFVAAPPEVYRSPVRFQVGPAGVTTGRNLGLGLGVGADFGTGTVGVRLAAAWLRGDARAGDPSSMSSPLGSSLGQYTGELTVDLHKRGPLHPVFGLGFGLLHVDGPLGAGSAGIGTARLGVEYSLGLEDADVRLGAGVTGVLPGPAGQQLADMHGYALVGAGISIGF